MSDAFVSLYPFISLLVGEKFVRQSDNEKYKRDRKKRSHVKMGRWRGWMSFKTSFIIPTKGGLLKAKSLLRHKAKGKIEVRRN